MTKSVYLIGASTRLGFQPYLQDMLAERAIVSGPAVNCGDSQNIIDHVEAWLMGQRPDIVCVTCGLHDLRYAFAQQKHQIPLSDYKRNIGTLFEKLNDITDARIFWQSCTPINETVYNTKPMAEGTTRIFHRYEQDVRNYNEAARDMAYKAGIPVIDLHAALLPFKNRLLTEDGIHWTAEGSRMMADVTMRALNHLI